MKIRSEIRKMRVRKGITMRELIPSKDVREYMEKKGKKLTDFERATLAYNYPGLSIGGRLELLKEIMDTTQDQKLLGQIRERIAYHKKCVEKFYENKKGMMYVLETYDEDDWRPADWCYFASGELAYASGKKLGECFSIAKYRIFEKEIDMEKDGHYSVSNLHYDEKSDLWNCSSDEVAWEGELDEDDDERFEDAYVDLPYPFRTGDLVREVGSDEIGVVQSERTDEEYELFRKRAEKMRQEGYFNSYGDASIPVEYPDVNGNFGHSHVLIANIEYAVPDENDPKREVLEYASLMLKKRCYIQEFQMVCRQMKR